MPAALLIVAFCAGLTTASIWLALGGTPLNAVLAYILSGQIAMAFMVAGAALRTPAPRVASRP